MLIRNDAIFRREAVDFQRRRLSGNVVLRPDPPLTVACAVYGLLVIALSAAFAFTSIPAVMRVTATCTPLGSGYLEVAQPHLSPGSVLRRAELATTDGMRVAVWTAGQGTRAGKLIAAVTSEHGPGASDNCAITYRLISRPADAVLHRLLRGS